MFAKVLLRIKDKHIWQNLNYKFEDKYLNIHHLLFESISKSTYINSRKCSFPIWSKETT